ncbi:MAG: 1-acyl-sn-glycerol-3-phosphate acyltransferase [Elusimicrobia bacterium]|nr:1-acyl-sn-glycerol-3-phosphate acyltransferase [Elusimicrobiota bacterium]
MSVETWRYETAADLEQPYVERLRNFPREPDMLVYAIRSLAALALRLWLKAFHRFEVVGRENLPVGRSFVLVANHGSHLDTLCLLSALPLSTLHRAFPAAAADYFFESVPRIWVAAVLVNALPFARKVHIRQSMELCRRLLETPGNVLLLFPEGTRATAPGLQPFKPGIGALLAGRDVLAVPCLLQGTFEAWPKGGWPRPRRVRLIIGAPRGYAALPRGRDSATQVAADLESAVRALGGPA